MNRFIEAVKNMFRIEDLRTVVVHAGPFGGLSHRCAYFTPGINNAVLEQLFSSPRIGTGHFRPLQRRQLRRLTIFALGIMPYITSSIILQLMTVVFRTSSVCKKKANSAGARYAYTRY